MQAIETKKVNVLSLHPQTKRQTILGETDGVKLLIESAGGARPLYTVTWRRNDDLYSLSYHSRKVAEKCFEELALEGLF